MFKYRGTVAYDGRNLSGWQRQANTENTIQEWLEKAVAQISREKVHVIGAGRTDAGVHAENQVFHFSLRQEIETLKLRGAINGNIPREVAVLSLERVSKNFHALRDARQKWYRYRILNRHVRCPLRTGFVLFVPSRLDIEAMKEGASFLQGEQDFSSFCASRSGAKTTVRNLERLDISRKGDEIHLDFMSQGFLYKMVRNITGTLIEVGRGKLPPEAVNRILQAKDRRMAGPTAPGYGLILRKIEY